MSNPGQSNPDQIIMTFGEFLADAHTNDLFQQVADEIAQEQKEAVVADPGPRTDEEWGVLAHQMVAGGSQESGTEAGDSGQPSRAAESGKD